MLKKFLSAVAFLTVFPVVKKEFENCTTFFPLVGLCIGVVLVAVNFFGSFLFPKNVVDMLVIVSLVIITGGLHLDGFADTLDGFYAGKSKNDTLRIMDDAHIGAMGVIGIFCILGLKFFALQSIPQKILYPSLLSFPTLSRWSLVLACTISKPAKSEGLGKVFVDVASKRDFIVATIFAILVSFFIFGWKGFLILVAVFFISLIFLKFISRKIGGITGDILGALNETIETLTLLILCIT